MPCVALPVCRVIFPPRSSIDTLHYHYGLPSIFLRSESYTVPLPYVVESYFPLGVEMLYDGWNGRRWVCRCEPRESFSSWRSAASVSFVLRTAWASAARGWPRSTVSILLDGRCTSVFMQKIDLGTTLYFFAFAYSILPRDLTVRRRPSLPGSFRGTFAGLAARHEIHHACLRARHGACGIGRTGPDAWDDGGRRTRRSGPMPCIAPGSILVFVLRPALRCFTLVWLCAQSSRCPWGIPVYPAARWTSSGARPGPPLGWRSCPATPTRYWPTFTGAKDLVLLLGSLTFFPDTPMSGPGASIGVGVLGTLLFTCPSASGAGLAVPPKPLPCADVGLVPFLLDLALPSSGAPFMSLLTGFLGDRLAERFGRRGGSVAIVLLVAAVGAQGASMIRQSPIHKAWAASFSLAGHPERGLRIASRFHPSLGAAAFVNARLPKNVKILFLGETRIYYFQRPVVAPSPYDEHPIGKVAASGPDPGTIRDRLAGQGYTHILVCWPEWERLGRQYYSRLWENGENEGDGPLRENAVRCLQRPDGYGFLSREVRNGDIAAGRSDDRFICPIIGRILAKSADSPPPCTFSRRVAHCFTLEEHMSGEDPKTPPHKILAR